jgi:tripartite-type tricarboxylate transporter receptor subunit TctC
VIVPYAPGGNTDVVGRIVAEHMSKTLGQQLVIENSAGAGGTTGSLRAARAEPNGYTLLVGQMGTHAASVGLYPKLAYDPVNDFEHISQLSDTPIAILVRKDFPAESRSPEGLKAFVTAEIGKWAPIMREASVEK